MRPTLALAFALALALLTTGCASNNGGGGATTTPTSTTPGGSNGGNSTSSGTVQPMLAGTYTATINTSMGDIVAQLYADKAPVSVANFLQDAQTGLYDGTVFHRVVKGFVIQGGGFAAPFTGSAGPRATPSGPIPTEIWQGNAHLAGTLGMARTNDPNSGSNQWFINTVDNHALDSGYTVFGKVTSGMDVVHAIENVPVTTKGSYQDVPTQDVVIRKVTVTTPDAPATPSLALFHASYDVVPGHNVSLPLLVKNVGGGTLHPTLAADAPTGATAAFDRDLGGLAPGAAGVAIVTVQTDATFAGGALRLTATDGAKNDTVEVQLHTIAASGNAAGPQHPKVQTYYIGVYDNGVVFDTTASDLASRGFTLPAGFSPHTDPLKVYVGSGSSPDPAYTPVIPGFASGVIGLQKGETRTVRLSSDEGYKDGYFRIFEMSVASVDG